MKHWGMLLFLITSGCATGPTAYRAHFASETEAEGVRACVDACRQSSYDGDNPHLCLAACPGFSSRRGDRCTPGGEAPGTLCVTVEDRLVPSEAFWSAVFEAALDEALADREPDSSDEPAGDSAGETRATARDTRAHTPARPSSRGSATRERRRSSR
ncbi:MAG: hypothetical protein KJ015_20740 [Myxococcales bacterium]|nr:hypothetical protein [Sorangiineae bacterium PRO1]MCL4752603.1 hypothetical protein [Myxococcales bacterium]